MGSWALTLSVIHFALGVRVLQIEREMATRLLTRSLLTSKLTLSSVLSRSYTSLRPSAPPSSLTTSSVSRLRPLVAVAAHFHRLSPAGNSIRGFATRQTSTSLNDPNPNWSNRPPKETILLDGCDFEHWLVVLEKPEDDPTRDEIIDSYIKTLAAVVGSEEEARKKIYSVSTRHYYAFGALVSEELSYKLKEIPKVRWVLPDSYLDVRNKDYGGEPFIDGQALPYDPKYHEEWVRNNARAQDRNRRNDRPRNFDRSRNFERRRENIQNRDHQMQNPGSNMGGPPPQQTNMGGPPQQTNMGSANNMGGQPPMNMGRAPNVEGPPPGYIGSQSNMGVTPNNRVGAPNMGNMPQNNMGQMPQNSMRGPPNMAGSPNMGGGSNMGGNPNFGGRGGGPGPNMGGMPTNNMAGNASNLQYGNGPNMGGMPTNNVAGNASNLQYGNGPNMGGMPTNNMAGNAPNLQYGNGPNRGGMPFQNKDMSGQGQNREYQHGYDAYNAAGENPYQNQNQNISGRDMPPSPGY